MARTDETLLPSYRPDVPTSGTAIAALVLAVASFLVLPVIPALIALYLAARAKKEIRGAGGALQGESLARAATIVAGVNVGLFVAAIALVAVALGVPLLVR